MALLLNGDAAPGAYCRQPRRPSWCDLGRAKPGGGIYLSNGNLLMETVEIAGNVARRGDALAVQNSNALTTTVNMNYVTLVGGNPRAGGAVASLVRASGTWTNFILLNSLIGGGPVAFEGQNYAQDSTLDYTTVLIDDNVSTTITGTISANRTPLRGAADFADAGAGDYHLTAASSAVDRGSILPPLFDLDGVTRPKGVPVDIGAYEFVPPGLADQTIAFAPLPDKLVSDLPFTVSATASSGPPVSLAALTPNVCAMSGGQVTLLATGTCLIRAGQAGDAAFNPAPPVTQAFAVKSPQKAGQSITFARPTDRTVGDLPFALSANASSGLPVSFTGAAPSVCLGDGATVILVAAGVCAIIATQQGNATINQATPVEQRFPVWNQEDCAEESLFLPMVAR